MTIGMAASRVSNPARISTPQAISKTPSKEAKKPGAGIPALSKRRFPRRPAAETSGFLAGEHQPNVEPDEQHRRDPAGRG